MNPIGAIILSLLLLVVLGAPRRWAGLGMAAGVLFLTQAQAVNVGGFNLFAIRFLEMAAFIRVLGRREFSFKLLNKIDSTLVLLYGFTTIVFCLRSSEGQVGAIAAAVDAFLCYFSFRGLIASPEDLRWFLRAFIFLLAPYSLLVLMESRTGHNPFVILGGMEGGSRWTRHDRPRCFASFRQPDTLGMFAASFIPLYIAMACLARERRRAVLAIVFCLIIAWAANSGGPGSAVATGLAGWGMWRYRTAMRKVRWGIVAVFVALALVMKAPVWYIFAHISNITGGDGWHRSYLIDVAFHHLGLWWLAGMPYLETKDWFPYHVDAAEGADITNLYLSFGLEAGLGAIALFVLLLTRAFSHLGRALAAVRGRFDQAKDDELLLWGLGVMLVIHIVDWFGITYFDQMYVIWFMQLAAVSSLSASCTEGALAAEEKIATGPEAVANLEVTTAVRTMSKLSHA